MEAGFCGPEKRFDGPYIEPVQYECVECDIGLYPECSMYMVEWCLLCTQSQCNFSSLIMNIQLESHCQTYNCGGVVSRGVAPMGAKTLS